MFEKNLWLVRIRWIYPVFIMSFFLAYRFLAQRSLISQLDALLVFLLPVVVNFLFWLDVRAQGESGRPAGRATTNWCAWPPCSSISTW